MDAQTTSEVRRLKALRDRIRHAETTLATLQVAIAEARLADPQTRMRLMKQENDRLHAELDAQHSRASVEADSAFAALQDAIRSAETDPLTQLPNRIVLWERLSHDLALAKRHGSPLAVLFIDLDGFKAVNDNLGHEAGDRLLQHVAQSLLASTRASDTVCRIGGDEFVVVATEVPLPERAGLVHKISQACSRPCPWGGHVLLARLSIGASSYPDDGDQAETLVRIADSAMYGAKRARGTVAQDGPVW